MLRILSDLHLFDPHTLLSELRQLEPLLVGVETLVINGDSCEMRRGVTPQQIEAMKRFFAERVPRVIFVTGNHDPDISDVHEYHAAEGRVWVLHGDVCFDDLTPWSRHLPQVRQMLAAFRAAEPDADYTQLPVRFRLARRAAREEADVLDVNVRGWRVRVAWFWRTFFPPRQVWAMIRAWRDLPALAAALARTQRPIAQVIVTGHVHFPRVWRLDSGLVVVNTGSFFRPLGGNLVDVHAGKVEVRRIIYRGGRFHVGKQVAEIPLKPLPL